MLTPATRQRAWALLWEYGLIDVIFRFLPAESQRAALNRERSLFLQIAPGRTISFGLALAAGVLEYRTTVAVRRDVLALVTRQELMQVERAMRGGLKLSNDELGAMVGILKPLAVLLAEAEPGLAAMKRFLARPTAAETRTLLAGLAGLGTSVQRIAWLEGRFAEFAGTDVAPPPLITGDDLVAAGMTPGPLFRRVLERVYDAQLEGRVRTRDEAMTMAMSLRASNS